MIYADSSFLVALKVRRDTFHEPAVSFYEHQQEETWLWSPWQRLEVFNTIRQLTRGEQQASRLWRYAGSMTLRHRRGIEST